MTRTVALALVLGSFTAALGCAPAADQQHYVSIVLPDFNAFAGDANNAGVHTFLEKRCGTLDCHGQIGRPFRLYSTGGLRLLNDAGLASGLGADTPEEIYANYTALVTVQPEETSKVVSGLEPPTALLVVAKPLGLQTHKGGMVFASGAPGDVCLETWLTGHVDMSACDNAAMVP
jgi:hypothetical protein